MMSVQDFEKLYVLLFELAWNSEYVITNSKKYINAIKVASSLLNGCSIDGGKLVRTVLFYWKTEIKIHKAKSRYYCINNTKHVINSNMHYGRIMHDGPGSWYSSSKMCLPCAARVLITLLTNFPPTNQGGNYIYPLIETINE